MRDHNPKDVFTGEMHDTTIILVTGGQPYLWIGDSDENFIDTMSGDDLIRLRDRITAALREARRIA